jgi:hypothetical protein
MTGLRALLTITNRTAKKKEDIEEEMPRKTTVVYVLDLRRGARP